MAIKRPKPQGGNRVSAPSSGGGPPTLEHPVFCLRDLQRNYDLNDCSHDQQRALVQKFRELSRLTWIEIRSAHRHGLGAEKISHDAIIPAVPPVVTQDVTLLAFRFSGRNPMVGFRSGPVFKILWLDHNFTVYDHG